jgi:hypothetical protein
VREEEVRLRSCDVINMSCIKSSCLNHRFQSRRLYSWREVKYFFRTPPKHAVAVVFLSEKEIAFAFACSRKSCIAETRLCSEDVDRE